MFKNPLNDKDREDTNRVARRLMLGLTNTSPSIHRDLIESYLQEAVIYGKTGHWVLEEAAEAITASSSLNKFERAEKITNGS